MSVRVSFTDGRHVDVHPGESLLDACRRSALAIPHSCGAGICHTCMFKAVGGEALPAAQMGLPAELRLRNYVLACRCFPQGPMVLAEPDPLDRHVAALLHEVNRGGRFLYMRLETQRELHCTAGGRLSVVTEDGQAFELQVTATSPADYVIEGLCEVPPDLADVLLSLPFGADLSVNGPLAGTPREAEQMEPPPDPALWKELGEGATVAAVLRAFYERVYADPRLALFFDGITIQRSIEKQFSFLKQLMTGERVYFGDRPRNAHHWMVISNELFDSRQALMREQLLAHGLTESQISRWTRFEVHYRGDIVKPSPRPRRIGGIELPLDGYAQEVLSEGTLCDHCGGALAAGTRVHYHVRLGKVSCPACVAPH